MQTTRLALVRFANGGTCYGQGATEEIAIGHVWRQVKGGLWPGLKLKKDARVIVSVYDYEPYSHIEWDGAATYGKREDTGKYVAILPLAKVTLDAKGKVVDRLDLPATTA